MEDSPFDFNTPITEDTTLIAKYDCPNGVTLTQLRAALINNTAATAYPVNTQIDDYTNGAYDPWIVGHYGTQYGDSSATGVYLYRKYLYPENQSWGTGATYGDSTINTWLNTTYLESCSDEIKGMVTQVSLPLVSGSTPAKMFLMSAAEVMALSTGYAGGVAWDSWKERTSLTAPSTDPNSGRIMSHGELANGQGETWLLRTVLNGQSGNADIEGDGACRTINTSTPAGVAVACFIAKPAYDPSNPTLTGLKAALDAGDYTAFPAGTEIPDTYNGQSNPLIVAQYLDETNNSAYYNSNGVVLVRKYVEPIEQTFGSNVNYITSAIIAFLDTTYYNNCSEELKSTISNFGVPYYTGTQMEKVTGKWFLMSAYEVCNKGNGPYEGVMWDYWKQKTGLSSPDALGTANTGRIMKDRNEATQTVWLRSRYSDAYVCYVFHNGDVNDSPRGLARGVLPACFIAKSASGPITAQEYNDRNITAESYATKTITANDYNNNAKGVL